MAKFNLTPIVIRTSLDEHGSLLDVARIAGESLIDYSKRLFDAYANRASSTYDGLLNGINRELGLEKQDIIKIGIRPVGMGNLLGPSVSFTQTTITNTDSHTNLIDGIGVTAIGAILSDNTQSWIPGHLRGYKLKIDTETYEVLDNTETTATIDGDMSGLVGFNYALEVDWEENSLIGLGLQVGTKLYKIAENNSNTLLIQSGDIFDGNGSTYILRAYNPKVEVTGSSFNLYKEYSNEENFQLEKTIDIREGVRFHRDIVSEINELKFFEAINLLDPKVDIFSFALNKQSSEVNVLQEIVPAAKFFKLQSMNIKEGSVKFTEANIFLREVEEDLVSQSLGNYNVDYGTGSIKVNTTPSGKKNVSYIWNDFPFTVTSSPAIISALNKEDSQEFLFLQQEMKLYNNFRERFRSSVPKADMIEYIAELLSVKPENWGE
jgi:hypothetical protein